MSPEVVKEMEEEGDLKTVYFKPFYQSTHWNASSSHVLTKYQTTGTQRLETYDDLHINREDNV